MLIIAIGYLYVVAMLAVAQMVGGHWATGLLTLVLAGILPVGSWLLLVSRRQRARLAQLREMQSSLETTVELLREHAEAENAPEDSDNGAKL